ncbi:MAG: hypothetical protein ACOC23_08590, partial [Thermodesulfobacteriota bacterium]
LPIIFRPFYSSIAQYIHFLFFHALCESPEHIPSGSGDDQENNEIFHSVSDPFCKPVSKKRQRSLLSKKIFESTKKYQVNEFFGKTGGALEERGAYRKPIEYARSAPDRPH